MKSTSCALRFPDPDIESCCRMLLFSGGGDQRLDLAAVAGDGSGDHFRVATRDDHVILDANADATPFRRHTLGVGSDIDARLDGDHHVWLEFAVLAVDAIVADI